MASQPRSTAREEQRRLKIGTLVIASVASAAAAAVTSQFWIHGTWMAAAVTPVIVALVSEMLHRPSTAIAERVTSRGTPVLPEAGAAAPPPASGDRAPAEPGSEGPPAAPPVRVYRTGPGQKPVRPRTRRRRIAVGMVAVTAVLAFAIAALAMTGTELVTGGSIGKGEGDTTLFGGDGKDQQQKKQEEQETQPSEEAQPQDGEQGSEGEEEDQKRPQPTEPSEEPPAEGEPEPVPRVPEAPAPQEQP
jgi:hypothetical protein